MSDPSLQHIVVTKDLIHGNMMNPVMHDEEDLWNSHTSHVASSSPSLLLGQEEGTDVGNVLPMTLDGDSEVRRRTNRRYSIVQEEEKEIRRGEYWMGWIGWMGTAAPFLPDWFFRKTKEDREESGSHLPGWMNHILHDSRANKWPLLFAMVCTIFCVLFAVKWTESLHDQRINSPVKLSFVYHDDKYDNWLKEDFTRTYNVPVDDYSFHLGRIKVPIYQKIGETTITFENIAEEMKQNMKETSNTKPCVSSAELGIPVNLILILITTATSLEETEAEHCLLVDPVVTQNSSKTVEIKVDCGLGLGLSLCGESNVSFPSQSRIEYKNTHNKKERITTKAELTHCIMNGIEFNTKYRDPTTSLKASPSSPSPSLDHSLVLH